MKCTMCDKQLVGQGAFLHYTGKVKGHGLSKQEAKEQIRIMHSGKAPLTMADIREEFQSEEYLRKAIENLNTRKIEIEEKLEEMRILTRDAFVIAKQREILAKALKEFSSIEKEQFVEMPTVAEGDRRY